MSSIELSTKLQKELNSKLKCLKLTQKERQLFLKLRRGQDLGKLLKKQMDNKKLKRAVINQQKRKRKESSLSRVNQKKVARKKKTKEEKAKENNHSHPDL